MKNFKLFVFSILILVLSLFTLKQIIPTLKLDGYFGLIFSMISKEQTKYSENYSNEKFLKIKLGMSKDEVLKIIGNPIIIWNPENDVVAFQYSESPNSSHYRIRQVYFKDEKVIKRISEFFLD